MTSVRDRLRVPEQRSLLDLERRRDPDRPPPRHLLVRNVDVQRVGDGVDGDHISVLNERDRSSDLSLGDDVTDLEGKQEGGRKGQSRARGRQDVKQQNLRRNRAI